MAIKFLSTPNLSTVTAGSLLKVDSNGNIVAATAGTDYITSNIWSTASSDNIYYNSGGVRIGTYQSSVDAAAQLHVFDYQTTDPKLLIEDGNTGDASMQFKISTQSYTMGIDNSDSDKFVLAASTALGTTNVLEVATGGTAAFQTGVLFKETIYMPGNGETADKEKLIDAHGTRATLYKGGNAVYWQVAQGGNQFQIVDAANGNDTKGNVLLHVSGNDADDNVLYLATASGKVSIGSQTAPSATLQVAGDDQDGVRVTGGTNGRVIQLGGSELSFYTTSTSGWAMGNIVRKNSDSSVLGYISGGYGDANGLTYTYYGGTAYNSATMYIRSSNVGIGTNNPAQELEVVGTIQATSAGTATLILRGDSGNSGDTGQLDSTIKMLHDDGNHGILLETRNYAGAQSFEIKSLASGTETSRFLIDQDGTLKVPAYGAGFLTTDANGDVSVDTTSYVDSTGDTMTGDLTIKRGHGDLTFLTLKQEDTSADLEAQKSFIDFHFIDSNANDYPQVRIGAEVGNNDGSASTTLEEGMGAFVVYTNNATTANPGTPSNLSERFRVDYQGNLKLSNYTAGLLKTDANGNVSLDTNTYSTASGVADNADAYGSWTVSDGTNAENVTSGTTVAWRGSGATSVSYDAETSQFTISSTNTQYSAATTSAAGLMSSTDKTKLDGIEASADVTDTANVVAALTAGSNISISAAGSISASNTDTVTSVGVSGSETTGTITLSGAGATTLTQSGGGIEIRSTDTQYTLPVAGSSIGGVKSGTDITVDVSGNVSVNNDSHTHDGRYYTETEINTYFERGYITHQQASSPAIGWYTIAQNTGDRALGEFQIWDTLSSRHQSVIFNAAHHFGMDDSNSITVLANSSYDTDVFRYIRIKENDTYDGAAIQVYIDNSSSDVHVAIVGANAQESGWDLVDWLADDTAPSQISGWDSATEKSRVDLDNIHAGGIATTGKIYAGGATTQYRVLTTNDEGTGNGLDADTLDGNHASAFSTASGVEDNADVTDATNVAAAGALMTAGGTMSGELKLDSNFKWATTNASSYTYSNADSSGLYIETVGNTDALSDMRFQARASGAGNYSSIAIKPSNQSIVLRTNGTNALVLDTSQNATLAGKLYIGSVDATTTATTALLLGAAGEVKKRALGSNAFSSTSFLSLAGGTVTGQVIFPSASTTKPVLPNGYIARNDNSDTDGTHDIWGISERYYPSNSTDEDAWGIQWAGTPNEINFIGAGQKKLSIDLDTAGTVKIDGDVVATQSYVGTAISNLVDSAPAALDTLNELAAALGDDASFSTTMSTALGNRLRIDVNNQSLSSTELSNARTNLGLGTAATAASTDFVAVSGDTMTGNLTMSSATPTLKFSINGGENNAGIVWEDGDAGDPSAQAAAIKWDASSNHMRFYNNDEAAERIRINSDGTTTFLGTINASAGIGGLTLANGGISGTNYNITGVNQLEISDPGEGIVFKSGSSGDMTLAIVDDANDNILKFSGTNAKFEVAGSLKHSGLELTTGSAIDQISEFAMTFRLTADTWTDTDISGTDLSTGTYAMQVYVSDFGVGGQHYYEYYSATISWYGDGTNSTAVDEIPMHRAGHAPNAGDIQFRTQRASGTDTHDLMLQVKTNQTYTGNLDNSHGGKIMRFKFRRLM